VTDYRLWDGSVVGPAASIEDVSLNLATEFRLGGVAPLWLKGVSIWRADATQDGAIQVHVWEITAPGAGSLITGSQATVDLSANPVQQWVDHLYPTPIPLALGVNYQAAALLPSGYVATADYWSSGPGAGGIADGPLSAPSAAASTGGGRQGSLSFDTVPSYPTIGSGNAANYWVQPIITDVDPAGPDIRSGSIVAPLATGLTPAGAKTAAGALAPAVATAMTFTGQHASSGTAQGVLTTGLTVTGGPGLAPAATSDVLCSPWAAPIDVPEAIRDELGLSDLELLPYLIRASEILWALSGRRWYGEGCVEEAEIRSFPPAPGTESWPYSTSWGACPCWRWGTWVDGRLYPPARDWRGQHITRPIAVRLPRSRARMLSVTVGGDPFLAYRVTPAGWVERTDGRGWGVCDGDTVFTYTYGEPPPLGGRDAAVELAVELARDAVNSSACRLPQRTTSVSRQGVSFEVLDSFDFLDRGRTGLVTVDLWLASVNPDARPQPSGVWSPDIPVALRRPQ
jgi:hypothetical protein